LNQTGAKRNFANVKPEKPEKLYQQIAMKKVLANILLLFVLGVGVATRSGDVYSELKLSPEEVTNQVFSHLTEAYSTPDISYESRRIARQLSAQARVSAVRGLYAAVRAYTQSEDFKSRYDEWLRAKYHISDAQADENLSTVDLRAVVNEQLDQTMEAFTNMPPTMLALMAKEQTSQIQEQIKTAEGEEKAELTRDLQTLRQLQPLAGTKPAEFKTKYLAFTRHYMARQMGEGLEKEEQRQAEAQARAQEHKADEAAYRANANPNLALKKKLREFIVLAESVDFDAQTQKQGYKVEFVREDYRQKSREWKQLYRIGREPVLAARDLARTWLSELN
jgi:hypothetical protein